MIKELVSGMFRDDDVPEGLVYVERNPASMIDLYCGPETAQRLLSGDGWDRVVELFGDNPGQTYAIPEQYLLPPLEDEMIDVVRALRLLEPDWASAFCQYPPCILPNERVAGGYGLCAHHGDALVDRAAAWAA